MHRRPYTNGYPDGLICINRHRDNVSVDLWRVEKAVIEAEAIKRKAELEAEAVKAKMLREAEAEAEATRIKLNAEAEGTKNKLMAEAEGKRASLLAEAEAIQQKELAPAMALERMVAAVGGNPDLVVQYKMVDQYKGIAEAQAKVLEHVQLGNVTVYGDKNTGAEFAKSFVQNFAPAIDILLSLALKYYFI